MKKPGKHKIGAKQGTARKSTGPKSKASSRAALKGSVASKTSVTAKGGVVSKGSVVCINYEVRGTNKTVIDSSKGRGALPYLHGYGQVIVGLERALEGKRVGDRIDVKIDPKDGYGAYDERLCQVVDRDQFPKGLALEVGGQFHAEGSDDDTIIIRITKISGDKITIDGNHPLAGQRLHFNAEVVAIRAATKSEIKHGHAHGVDGTEKHDA